MTETNTVQLASVRLLTDDVARLVGFYEAVTGVPAQWLTDDFAEMVTPSATVAVSHLDRVAFVHENPPRAAANHSVITEFLVDDVDRLFEELRAAFGDDLGVVQPPSLMPWGNQSALLHDPDGSLINLYTPVTPQGLELQRGRQPQPRGTATREDPPVDAAREADGGVRPAANIDPGPR